MFVFGIDRFICRLGSSHFRLVFMLEIVVHEPVIQKPFRLSSHTPPEMSLMAFEGLTTSFFYEFIMKRYFIRYFKSFEKK